MNYFINDWDSDCAIMYDILETIPFYSGSERSKMLYVNSNIGGSMLYGVTWKSYLTPTLSREFDIETSLYKTKVYSEYPELKDVFREFADLYFPEFAWSQCQMNKSYPCPPHKDSKNIGNSCLVAFGNYKGGNTCLFKNDSIIKIDARKQPTIFNGSEILHWVDPIKGNSTRYSLVFFNNNKKLIKN